MNSITRTQDEFNTEAQKEKQAKEWEAKHGVDSITGSNIPLGTVIIIVISFVVLIISSCLGLYVAETKNINYKNINAERAIKGTFTALIGVGILLPILYFMFHYVKTTSNTGRDIKQSKKNLLGVAYITYIFLLLSTSLGIWLCTQSSCNEMVHDSDGNINHEFSQHSKYKENPATNYKIVFAAFLVVGILSPILYSLFYFKDDIMNKYNKKQQS